MTVDVESDTREEYSITTTDDDVEEYSEYSTTDDVHFACDYLNLYPCFQLRKCNEPNER